MSAEVAITDEAVAAPSVDELQAQVRALRAALSRLVYGVREIIPHVQRAERIESAAGRFYDELISIGKRAEWYENNGHVAMSYMQGLFRSIVKLSDRPPPAVLPLQKLCMAAAPFVLDEELVRATPE